MISYYKFGKGKLLTCEDSLTASIIDPLKYLPSDLFWHVLKKSALTDNLPSVSGPILSISFWDKWKNTDNTTNSKYVEPDVFIRFLEFDLIIEAKRRNENLQYSQQLENEVVAYRNEYGEDNKELHLIQLGGINIKDETDKIYEAKVTKMTWTGILNTVFSINRKLNNQNLPGQENLRLILSDIKESLGIHGFFRKSWLSDLNSNHIQSKTLNNNKLKYNQNGRDLYRG